MDTANWQHLALASLVWVVSLILAALIGWVVTILVLRLARVEEENAEIPTPDGAAHLLSGQVTHRPVLRGGLWIGILERIAVASAIISAHPELIAVVVAVKGLGRYPELKDNPAASERFLIGTGASLLVSAAVGMCGAFVLTLI